MLLYLELDEWLLRQEMILKQKLKKPWIEKGDKNSQQFVDF